MVKHILLSPHFLKNIRSKIMINTNNKTKKRYPTWKYTIFI